MEHHEQHGFHRQRFGQIWFPEQRILVNVSTSIDGENSYESNDVCLRHLFQVKSRVNSLSFFALPDFSLRKKDVSALETLLVRTDRFEESSELLDVTNPDAHSDESSAHRF